MLTEAQRLALIDWFAVEVQGGTSEDIMSLYDKMIDEGLITQDEFRLNETEICAIVDHSWFTCEGCGWTLPMSEQDGRGEWHCQQCMDEEHGDCDY